MKQHNKQQVWLVTKWEFMHFFKWKQEIISKLIMFGLIAVIFAWQHFKTDSVDVYKVAVFGPEVQLKNTNKFTFVPMDVQDKSLLVGEESEFDAVLEHKKTSDNKIELELTSFDKQDWQIALFTELNEQYRLQVAEQFNLESNQLELLQDPIELAQSYLNEAIKSEDESSEILAFITIFIMAMGIFTSFGQLFASITGEKQQRVTEQLYSCISAQTWIDGKIFGQMLHAVKAMFTTAISGFIGYAFMVVIVDSGSIDLSQIDWSFVPPLLIFSLVGIYISTAFIAAIAAAIDDPNHSGKTGMTLIPMLPLVLTFMTLSEPSGWAMTLLSYLPFTAFIAMPVKMSLVDVPWWQVLIAFTSCLVFALWLRQGAARMFKMGMVMYGKEPDFATMMAWMITEPKHR